MGYFIQKNLSLKERELLIDHLHANGCYNIYLLHNIFNSYEKSLYITNSENSLFAVLLQKSKELHFFTKDNSLIPSFISFMNENSISYNYLGIDSFSAADFMKHLPNSYIKILVDEEYYILTIDKETFFAHYAQKANCIDTISLSLRIPTSKKQLSLLIPLQKGYMYEEMHYPSHILYDKFVLAKLTELFKTLQLFYAVDSDTNTVIAKCEWNAYTHQHFQIGGVYTLPGYRKQGVGYFLINKMLEYSFNFQQMNYAYLFVRKTNEKAISLYQRSNFVKKQINLRWIVFKNKA